MEYLNFLLSKNLQELLAPQYIQDLINDYTPQRNLRSGSKCLLETPNYNLESYGKRAFSGMEYSPPALYSDTQAGNKNRLSRVMFCLRYVNLTTVVTFPDTDLNYGWKSCTTI